MRTLIQVLLLISFSGFVFALSGCNGGKDQTNIELIQDMMEQPNLKSQEYDDYFKRAGVRTPPANTVSREFKPYKYKGDPVGAEQNLKNPVAVNDKTMSVGAEKYNIYCAVCHGQQGKGDGQIAQYMSLRPPSLVSDKVRGFKDGRIFHIITEGQGVMGTYATQIYKEEDRWAIVNYVRSLQKGN